MLSTALLIYWSTGQDPRIVVSTGQFLPQQIYYLPQIVFNKQSGGDPPYRGYINYGDCHGRKAENGCIA